MSKFKCISPFSADLLCIITLSPITLASHVEDNDRRRVHTPSCIAREALMQEDEPRCCQPQLQYATITQCFNSTRHVVMDQQCPMSPLAVIISRSTRTSGSSLPSSTLGPCITLHTIHFQPRCLLGQAPRSAPCSTIYIRPCDVR